MLASTPRQLWLAEELRATAETDPAVATSVDDRSDQYMLGVVLFEILAGRRLFAGGEQEFKDWAQTAVVPTISGAASPSSATTWRSTPRSTPSAAASPAPT